MSCISPSSLGGGQAISASHSTGFGGSPGSTTVKYVAADSGSLSGPSLSLTSPISVGVDGAMRQMVPVKYNLDQSSGGGSLSVTFQDYLPLKLSRMFIALNDPKVNVPSGSCVRALGSLHHKPAGAPSAVDETTVSPGPAPKIKEGNSWKTLGEEYIFYSSSELAGAAGGMIGPQLRGVVAGHSKLMNQTGSLLSIIQGIAGESGAELYSDNSGRIDVKPPPGGAPSVGNGCGIISMSVSSDITCTSAEGGYAIYKHEDQWRRKLKQRFKGIDLLGIPIDDCEGEKVRLMSKDMGEETKSQLERALKMGWLDQKWPNWRGFMTYVYLKRAASGATDAAEEGELKVLKLSDFDEEEFGKNIPPKKSKRKCKEVASMPIKRLDSVGANGTIDKLYSCLSPAKLDVEEIADDIKANFETNFKKGDTTGVVAKLPQDVLEYMVLEQGAKLECDDDNIVDQGSSESSTKTENNIVDGSQVEQSSILSELSLTIGRYYVMSGGGQGGGGGAITERQHNLRKYNLESGGRLIWYDPDLDVRETVFSSVYLALYGKLIEEQEGDHLSVGQFLQIAAKEKRASMGGNKTPRPMRGNGQSGASLKASAEALAKWCNNNEPKGIVVLDKEYDNISLPEQDIPLKQIGAGIELHNDRYTNDIVRYLMEQVKVGVMANPCKGSEAGDGGDCIDACIDKYTPHEDWRVGKRKSENVEYTILEDRKYYAAQARYPPCDQAYSMSVNYEDLSGKVIWRNVDCFGNVQEFQHPFNSGGAVTGALSRALAKMYKTNLDHCGSTTITACGSSVASMPGGGQTQDFNVSHGEDGSITTSFTVGGSESSLVSSSISAHQANGNNIASGPGSPAAHVKTPPSPPSGRGLRRRT